MAYSKSLVDCFPAPSMAAIAPFTNCLFSARTNLATFIQVFSLISHMELNEVSIASLFIDEATMTQRGKNLPMVTQLISSRAGLDGTQVASLNNPINYIRLYHIKCSINISGKGPSISMETISPISSG